MDNEKRKNEKRVILLLLVLNLFVSVGIIGFLVVEYIQKEEINSGFLFQGAKETRGKYLLYIGINDKDTYKQEISTEEARNIVNSICAKYSGGYTVSDAKGGWVDETATLTQENTFVYVLYDVTEEQLVSIMDEVLMKLNQSSILVEKQDVVYRYYSR